MDLPNALDAPERCVWRAYEFGSHNFDFLRAMYHESGGECGVVGVTLICFSWCLQLH